MAGGERVRVARRCTSERHPCSSKSMIVVTGMNAPAVHPYAPFHVFINNTTRRTRS